MSSRYIIDKKNRRRNGFTLIELMVTITLIMMVMAIAFNMQSFSYRIFDKGSVKADIQSNLRINAEFISEKIRYASNVEILVGKPPSFDPNDHLTEYIYSESGLLKYYSNGSIINIPGNLQGVSSVLKFAIQDSKTVNFTIDGIYKNEAYQIESAAFLLNSEKSIDIPTILSDWSAIEFTPGEGIASGINTNPVTSISIVTVPSGVTEVGPTYSLGLKSIALPETSSIKRVIWSLKNAVSGASITAGDDYISAILTTNNSPLGGVIVVRALAVDGSGVVAEKSFTVKEGLSNVMPESIILVSRFGPIEQKYIFENNAELQFFASIYPINADKTVQFSIKSGTGANIDSSTGVLKTTSAAVGSSITVEGKTINDLKDTETVTVIQNFSNNPKNDISIGQSAGNQFTLKRISSGIVIDNSGKDGIIKIEYQIGAGIWNSINSGSANINANPGEWINFLFTRINGKGTFEMKTKHI